MLVLFGFASIFPLIYKQNTLPVIFWVAVWGGLGLYCLYCLFFHSAIPVSKIVLKKAEGPIKFVAMDASNNSEIEYDLRIGKVKLQEVSNDCTEIMKKGDVYAVYYYDLKDGSGNHVTSLEWLENGKG